MKDYFIYVLYVNSLFGFLLVVRTFLLVASNKNASIYRLDKYIGFIALISYALLCGLRPVSVGADTPMYVNTFNGILWAINNDVLPINLQTSTGFFLFNKIFSTTNHLFFFVFISLAFNSSLYYLFSKLFKKLFLEAYLFMLFSFFYFNFNLNAIRNGLAMSFVFLSFVFLLRQKRIQSIFMVVGASLVHIASAIYLFNYVAPKNFKSYLFSLAFTFISLVLLMLKFDLVFYILNIALQFVGDYGANKLWFYLNYETYQTGLRWDFVLFGVFFSLFPVFYYWRLKFRDNFYYKLCFTYNIIIAMQFLCFNIPGNDRVGILGWIMSPIIIFYPLSQYKLSNQIRLMLVLMILFWGGINLPFIYKYYF